MRSGEVPYQLLQRLEADLAEAALELVGLVLAHRDGAPVHRAQMLK